MTNFGFKTKSDLLDSPKILAQQKKLVYKKKVVKQETTPFLQKSYQVKDIAVQLNVQYPEQGYSFGSLTLLPDFKTMQYISLHLKTSERAKEIHSYNLRSSKALLKLATNKACFGP